MRVSRLKLSQKKKVEDSFLGKVRAFLFPSRAFASFLLLLSRFRFSAVLGGIGFVVAVTFILFQIGIGAYIEAILNDWILRSSAALGYRFEDVYIQGRQSTSKDDVLNAIGIKRGDSLFKHTPAFIKERLESITWIEHADVRRFLPGILHIDLVERRPIALWQHQRKFYYVDENGVVLQTELSHPPSSIPVIVGNDAPQHAPKLMKLLSAYKEVREHLTAMVRQQKRRWDIVLSGKLTIKLPETQVEVALARLNFLLEAKKLNLDELLMIDLRMPKQLVVRVSPQTAARLNLKTQEAALQNSMKKKATKA